MERSAQLQILSELFALVDRGDDPAAAADWLIPVERYTSPRWYAAEQAALFQKLPLVVGHASEIRAPGDFITHDASGIPLLIVRSAEGPARAYLNVCRHRGTKLVWEPSGHAKASFVCPYHAWTYGISGDLLRVPRRDCFPSLKLEETGLMPVPLAERCGFLWAIPGGRGRDLDIDSYLGPIAPELSGLGLDHHVVHRQVTDRKKANWKLVIDAFLEGYHLRSLHRDTISRFFLDGIHMTSLPPHSRSFGARKGMPKARTLPPESWDLRELTTPFYLLFPNTILVFHPDWITALTISPDGPEHLLYHHRMLIPKPPETEEQSKHWDKTFQLIEGSVFQREDLRVVEAIQAGFPAGVDTHFRIGHMERAVKWFHDEIAQRVEPVLQRG